MDRARDLSARAAAVVDKTTNLIVLETEATYLKWQDADRRARLFQPVVGLTEKIGAAAEQRGIDSGNVEKMIRDRTLEQQVRSQRNEALYEHALALAALERVTAGGFCPSFRETPATQP
jgi:hypothetical protein